MRPQAGGARRPWPRNDTGSAFRSDCSPAQLPLPASQKLTTLTASAVAKGMGGVARGIGRVDVRGFIVSALLAAHGADARQPLVALASTPLADAPLPTVVRMFIQPTAPAPTIFPVVVLIPHPAATFATAASPFVSEDALPVHSLAFLRSPTSAATPEEDSTRGITASRPMST